MIFFVYINGLQYKYRVRNSHFPFNACLASNLILHWGIVMIVIDSSNYSYALMFKIKKLLYNFVCSAYLWQLISMRKYDVVSLVDAHRIKKKNY